MQTMLMQSRGKKGGADGSENAYWSDVIEKFNGDEELFMFPMNTTRTSNDDKGYHWTLLVLQKTLLQQANGWRHYDSMGESKHFKSRIAKDCRTIVSFLKLFHSHIHACNYSKLFIPPTFETGKLCHSDDKRCYDRKSKI
jgi:hypothetical protein